LLKGVQGNSIERGEKDLTRDMKKSKNTEIMKMELTNKRRSHSRVKGGLAKRNG